MSKEDFDVDGLAVYLHLTPMQVTRLADRGKLPGRKVAGQWRFSQAEIHHWLEDRIGLSDEGELAEVAEVLEPPEGEVVESFSVAEILPLDAIEVPLQARTRNSVITAMAKLAAQTGLLWDADQMADAVRAREQLHPTALDNGVALLHPRRPMPTILAQPLLALGRTYQGIPFGGPRGQLTDIFFLICSTDDRGHLRLLTRLSQLIAEPTVLERIRSTEDLGEILQILREAEEGLT